MGILKEIGIRSILASPKDVYFLLLLRFLRFFAFGGTTIVLALYLHLLHFSDSQIGLLMSLTLASDVISFGLSVLADGIGRRCALVIGCAMMVGSGAAFAWSSSYPVLLLAGILGIISPNGREIGPFSAIEESILAHVTPKDRRSDVFAWYVLTGSAGAAVGKFITGWAMKWLLDGAWPEVRCYRWAFGAYAVVGLCSLGVVSLLSNAVELTDKTFEDTEDTEAETEPLLVGDNVARTPDVTVSVTGGDDTSEKRTLIPKISKESRGIIFRLCLLFAVDSLASGLVPASWLTYFFHVRFSLPTSTLGTLFSVGACLSALSSLVAASLSKHIGLVNTMVFTHLPSAIALSLIPLSPSLGLSVFFFAA